MSVQCSRCGAENRDNVPNCVQCGAPLGDVPTRSTSPFSSAEPQTVYQKPCINCNKMINSSLATCPYCGAQQHGAVAASSRNKVAAGVLAILLGTFGVHKFYLGQTTQGILYLLFCWTGIPSLAGIIEGIIYLTMTDYAFAQKYG